MLGPRGLFAELQAYREAVARGNAQQVMAHAAELLAPLPVPEDPQVRTRLVISRLLVLAGRRLFGVIFWYVVLGPTGAVMFRAADILRHHAEVDSEATRDAARQLYGVLEWAPSRILAGTYALAGSFDDAMAERRACYAESSGHFFEMNEDILACTGRGALAFAEQLDEVGELDAANNLLFRALVIWLAVLALLSLIGWTCCVCLPCLRWPPCRPAPTSCCTMMKAWRCTSRNPPRAWWRSRRISPSSCSRSVRASVSWARWTGPTRPRRRNAFRASATVSASTSSASSR